MELMHPACDFLPLSKLSFLSSVHTTWHLAALKSYCEEINSSKDGGTSLISPNILFAPCSHAVSLIFLSFQPLFYSPHFSPPMPLLHFLTSSLSLYHLLILSPIVLSPFHFFSFFFFLLFSPSSPLSSGACISLQVLQGTQRGAVKAAASPRTAASLLAQRGASEGQQH